MTGMAQRFHVVAVGARTPVGLDAESSAAAVRASISRLVMHPFMVDTRGEPVRMASDPLLDAKLFGWERMVLLAESALLEVITKLGPDVTKVGEVLVALPEERPGFSNADAKQVMARLAEKEPLRGMRMSIGGRGHAGALQAMAVAAEKLATGRLNVCIVLGVDSYAHADTIEWLCNEGQLLSETVRSGLIPGEAAGAIAVASGELPVESLATISGVHTAFESKLIKTDVDVLGEGLYAAISGAAAKLVLPEEAIDSTYCDINGERYRTDEWAFAVLRLGSTLRRTAYEMPSDCWGDVGAASAALGCVLGIQAWARGYAKGPRVLVWASSETGLRGAAVLEQPAS